MFQQNADVFQEKSEEREPFQVNRIVGIVLVRNEEHFVAWSLRNIAGFCDEIIVLDNDSNDGTPERLAALEGRFPHLVVRREPDPNRSHRHLEKYAGTKTWVFGVDGDEIYDPVGLARLRPGIVGGAYDGYWRIAGHMLNATRLDLDAGVGRGYGTPYTPSVTKLYNFGALASWRDPDRQRLSGRSMVFRPGYSRSRALRLDRREAWSRCDLRCLHLCFFPRTSLENGSPTDRRNPSQVKASPTVRALEGVKTFLRHPFLRGSGYKTRRYRRGKRVTRNVSAFGRPGGLLELDPGWEEAEAVLSVRRLTHAAR